MLELTQSVRAWNTPEFEQTLKRELQQQAMQLPLQQCLTQGSYVLDTPITVMVSQTAQVEECIRIHAGIMFQGMIAGCSCADDPSSGGETTEYCEIVLKLNLSNGQASVRLQE